MLDVYLKEELKEELLGFFKLVYLENMVNLEKTVCLQFCTQM